MCVGSSAGVTYLRYTVLMSSNKLSAVAILLYRFLSCWCLETLVIVVIQYRLGPFGFLTTGDSAAPGNVRSSGSTEVGEQKH